MILAEDKPINVISLWKDYLYVQKYANHYWKVLYNRGDIISE